MNSYRYIINPKTGRKVSVYGKLGRTIISHYMTGGSSISAKLQKKKGSIKRAAKQASSNISKTTKNIGKDLQSNKDKVVWEAFSDEAKCNFCLQPSIKENCAARAVELEKTRAANLQITKDKIKALLQSANTMENQVNNAKNTLQFHDAEQALVSQMNFLLDAKQLNDDLDEKDKISTVQQKIDNINRPDLKVQEHSEESVSN